MKAKNSNNTKNARKANLQKCKKVQENQSMKILEARHRL